MIPPAWLRQWERHAPWAADAVWAAALGAPGATAALLRAVLGAGGGPAGLSARLARAAAPLLGEAGGGRLQSDATPVLRAVARAARGGAAPVVVFGDSHARLYLRAGRRDGRYLLALGCVRTGASSRGLANPHGAAGAGPAAEAVLAALRAQRAPWPLLFVFGQVDVEFVHPFKRVEAGEDDSEDAFERFAQVTVERYVGWLDRVLTPHERPRAWLAPIFPPALSDAAWREGYLNAHIASAHAALDADALRAGLARLGAPTLAVRTRRHHAFNARLRARAARIGVGMLDAYDDLCRDGVVAPALLGAPAGADHHLDHPALQPYLAPRLWRVAQSVADVR